MSLVLLLGASPPPGPGLLVVAARAAVVRFVDPAPAEASGYRVVSVSNGGDAGPGVPAGDRLTADRQAGTITRQPLWPPKPKELDSVGPGSQGRGPPVTTSRWTSGSSSLSPAVGGISR